MRPIGSRQISEQTLRQLPTGGVQAPIASPDTIITPKCTPEMSSSCAYRQQDGVRSGSGRADVDERAREQGIKQRRHQEERRLVEPEVADEIGQLVRQPAS